MIGKIITISCMSVVGSLLIFFLTPAFIHLCEEIGENFSNAVDSVKDSFIETAEEWKYIFKRWFK